VAETIGKEDIFNQVLAQNKVRFRFIANQYAPPNDAQDLYHDILYKLWKNMDSFEGRSTPTTWAYRVALNTAITYRRDNLRHYKTLSKYGKDVQIGQTGGRGKARIEGRSEEQILREFTQSLPGMERSIFTLYLTNLSYQQIAEIANINEGTLRVKICRLRSKFEQRYL
jgi:RNA polymerase sigma-70 factor (ECF subfamily)